MTKNAIKIEVDGKTVENPKELAELFNHYFPEKLQKLASGIRKQDIIDPLEKLRNKVKNSNLQFEIKEVEEKDVMKILKNLKNKSSCGMDGISSEILKMGASVLCAPLTFIVNTSIISSKFPTPWKQAKVVPLHKKGSRRLLEKYRPVSLLPVSGMILEKVIADQIGEFLKGTISLGPINSAFAKEKVQFQNCCNYLTTYWRPKISAKKYCC